MSSNTEKDSIFFNPPHILRWAFIFLVFFVFIFSPTYRTLTTDALYPHTYSRLILQNLYYGIILIPFIFYDKTKFGILHPLIFSPALLIAKGTFKKITSILPSLMSDSPYFGGLSSIALQGEDQFLMADYHLDTFIFQFIYTFFHYVTYYYCKPGLKIKVFDKNVDSAKIQTRALYIILTAFAVSFVFFAARGGITQHFSSFGQGRQIALKGMGIIFVIINFSSMAIYIWASIDKTVFKKQVFWAVFLFSLGINFLTYGSRSSIFFSVLYLLVIWIIHTRKIPYKTLIFVGFFGFIAVAILGNLRRSTYKGKVDWSQLQQRDTEELLTEFQSEVKSRDVLKSPDIAVAAKAVKEHGLLLGKSYTSAILFFVPRFIWSDKPHSIGYYTGTMIFGSRGGIPPSIHMEAFWNFHIVGLILIGILHGYMDKWAVNFYIRNHTQKVATVMYLVMLMRLQPYSLSMIHFFQEIFSVLIIYYVLDAIAFKEVTFESIKERISIKNGFGRRVAN